MAFPRLASLTHAGDDAVHRQPGRPVVEGPREAALLLLVLVLKRRVLFLGDVNIETHICGVHAVAGAWVQQNVFIVLPPDTNQADTEPAHQKEDGRVFGIVTQQGPCCSLMFAHGGKYVNAARAAGNDSKPLPPPPNHQGSMCDSEHQRGSQML